MIALAADCLLFQLASGESVPFSAEMISVELLGDTAELFDAEFVRHASHAVFHYFKHDLGQNVVSVGEFAGALEKVLRGFVLTARTEVRQEDKSARKLASADLARLACESGKGCELFFFPKLRQELLFHLGARPSLLHFRGLKRCVKQLVGVQRWTPQCQKLREEIVEYIRQCLTTQQPQVELAMLVE